MREERKTISEWEQVKGIVLLDFDGFDQRDKKLSTRPFTQAEFEEAIMDCTILRKPRTQPEQRLKQATSLREETRKVAGKKHRFPYGWFLMFTMPTIATLAFTWMYRLVERFVSVKWYIPAGILFADLLILLIEPFSATVAGPFYLWYHLFDFVVRGLLRGFASVKYLFLHASFNAVDASKPFLSTVKIGGNGVNLFFRLDQAIASSVFWATTIVCLKKVWSAPRKKTQDSGMMGA